MHNHFLLDKLVNISIVKLCVHEFICGVGDWDSHRVGWYCIFKEQYGIRENTSVILKTFYTFRTFDLVIVHKYQIFFYDNFRKVNRPL